MISSTQKLIARIKNELSALKAASPLNVGALRFPDQTPTQSYSGTIDTTGQDYVVARLEATFRRSDGQAITPFVDFAFDYSVSPTYQEYMATQGITITGSDPNVAAEFYVLGYVADTSSDSVVYYVDVLNAVAGFAGSQIALNATIQAISTVEGTLTLRRTI